MRADFLPFRVLLLTISGWVHREQQGVIDYLVEENRVLREQIGNRRLRLTDEQRRRLAAKGIRVGCKNSAGRKSCIPEGLGLAKIGTCEPISFCPSQKPHGLLYACWSGLGRRASAQHVRQIEQAIGRRAHLLR